MYPMKKVGIVLVALIAILVLPGAAKADSFTGASGSTTNFLGLSGSGSFSASSLGGSQSFSFADSLFSNSITIGSGASAFHGVFTGSFTSTSISCGFLCFETQYTASFIGTGANAGETGSITLDVNPFTGQIVGGSADPNPGTGVPEPGTLGMFAAGLLGVGFMISRRSKTAQVTA
jgi:PEP-CTERM motif